MSPREFKTLVDSGSCTVIDTRSVSGGEVVRGEGREESWGGGRWEGGRREVGGEVGGRKEGGGGRKEGGGGKEEGGGGREEGDGREEGGRWREVEGGRREGGGKRKNWQFYCQR